MLLVPRGFSAVTVACGMLGMGQTVVTSVPMLIVGGTVIVKNRSETGRGEGEEGDRKGRRVEEGYTARTKLFVLTTEWLPYLQSAGGEWL